MVLFNSKGVVTKALEVPVEVAKEYGVANSHQNGWIISTTQQFINDTRSKDITAVLETFNL